MRVVRSDQKGVKFPKMRKQRKSAKKDVAPERVLQRQVNSYLEQAGLYYVRISDMAYMLVSKKDAALSGLPDNGAQIGLNEKFFLGCNIELKRKGGKKRLIS